MSKSEAHRRRAVKLELNSLLLQSVLDISDGSLVRHRCASFEIGKRLGRNFGQSREVSLLEP